MEKLKVKADIEVDIETYFKIAAENVKKGLWGFARANAEKGLKLLEAYRLLDTEKYTQGPYK